MSDQKKIVLFFILFFVPSNLLAVELLITQPGQYMLGQNLTSNPAGADNIIHILSNDVVLDLGGYVVSQGNATASVNGINLNAGFNDVTIQNGVIRSVTGNGIQIGATCQRIKILNIRFESCGIGLFFNGTVGLEINNGEIRNCNFYSCGNTGLGSAINMTSVSRYIISDIEIANTVSTALTSAFVMFRVTLSDFSNITIQNNSVTGAQLFGISDVSGIGNFYTNVLIQNNSGSTGFVGFGLNSSSTHTFKNCSVIFNSSSAGTINAYDIQTSTNCFFDTCRASSNTGVTSVNGFDFITTSQQNMLIDCIASANIASGAGADCRGFFLNDANFTQMIRCQSSFNVSSAANAIGLLISGAGGSTNSSIIDCIFSRNLGAAAATSFGISFATGSNNLFKSNIGFNNNTTAANQMSGVPAGSVQTPASPGSSNLTSVLTPYSNLALDA
ncbi:MAG: hypothetical protein BWY54_00623 [Candidatus Dependentiae bacterium ADurb.Bin331]|nr:MAG: hypothetical protein BWY54_00623 [Candidatus Dependentiae bacterium ADurb.Bin331]